jgi:hypothetical protein
LPPGPEGPGGKGKKQQRKPKPKATHPTFLRRSTESAKQSGHYRIRTTDFINATVECAFLEAIVSRYPHQTISLVLDHARSQHRALVMDKAPALEIELLFLLTK